MAEAQQAGKVYRIGFLRAGQPPTAWVDAFLKGLRELGYVDGQNLVVEFRFTDATRQLLFEPPDCLRSGPRCSNVLRRSRRGFAGMLLDTLIVEPPGPWRALGLSVIPQ